MKKVTVRVPLRADLAGGTLDLWPLYLFHPGSRTVNVAIGYHAECDVISQIGSGIEITLGDNNYHRRYASIAEAMLDPKVALIAKAVEHFHITGLHITTRTDAPRGSGLGGSSALAIALVRALSEHAEAPVDGEELINLVRDLETRLLGLPAGIQDYYPPVYGGLASLHLNPGRPQRHPIMLPLGEFSPHFILHYSGVSHFSGTNNWEIFKRHIDGDETVRNGLGRIAETAMEMEKALEAGNMQAAGGFLLQEWQIRKELIAGISTPEIESAVDVALAAGAWGAKVCGAGGGGCVVFLTPQERHDDVLRALQGAPGRTLQAPPVAHGIDVEKHDDVQPAFAFPTKQDRAGAAESIEQQYLVTNRSSDYKPYILAEGEIVYDESRSGFHMAIVRSLAAPIDLHGGRINWHEAVALNLDQYELRSVSGPKARIPVLDNPGALAAAAAEAEDTFPKHLEETEKLRIYFNPTFALYSEPNESRQTFLERCLEEANRSLETAAERLESSFRRRIDQMRERSDREQREQLEEDIEVPSEVTIAWGQTLYNMTSGKPPRTEAPQSPNEADYMGKISLLQKTWDKDLDALKEEYTASARSIEEIVLNPSPRNVRLRKIRVVWAPGWDSKPPAKKSKTEAKRRRKKTPNL